MPRFSMRTLLISLLAPSLLSIASCRSERIAPGAPNEAVPLARKLCQALHALPAERKASCCGTPPQRPLLTECERVVTRSLASRSVALDASAVDACALGMQRALLGCDWVTPSQPLAPPACRNLFRGKLLTGSACQSSLECAGNLHCEGSTPTKAGVCTPPAAVGAACGSHVDALAAYTLTRDLEHSHPFCADFCSLLSHKCQPSPAAGAHCQATVNCGEGQSCIEGVCSTMERRARELARPGEICSTDFDCAAGGCVAGSDGSKTCGAKCSVSLAMLKTSGGPGMRLPLRPRTEASR
jgi:hypothetical protein